MCIVRYGELELEFKLDDVRRLWYVPGPPETHCAPSALSHYHHHRIPLLLPSSSPMLSPRSSMAAYSLN